MHRYPDLHAIALRRMLDNDSALKRGLDLANPRFDMPLLVLGGIQRGIFAKVLVQHSLADLFADAHALRNERVKFGLQRLNSFVCQLHCPNILPNGTLSLWSSFTKAQMRSQVCLG